MFKRSSFTHRGIKVVIRSTPTQLWYTFRYDGQRYGMAIGKTPEQTFTEPYWQEMRRNAMESIDTILEPPKLSDGTLYPLIKSLAETGKPPEAKDV